jgi:UPF0716 family protein affecting phage T7 exclusion
MELKKLIKDLCTYRRTGNAGQRSKLNATILMAAGEEVLSPGLVSTAATHITMLL